MRPRRDGAGLEKSKAERGEPAQMRRVLVEARRQADAIGKFDAHHANRRSRKMWRGELCEAHRKERLEHQALPARLGELRDLEA